MRRGLLFALLAVVLGLVVPASAGAFGGLGSFGEFGGGAGQLSSPSQLAVAPDGEIYVADTGNDRISVFDGGGSFLGTIEPAGEPEDVTLDDGRAIVADTGNNRVEVFTPKGDFLFAFGKDVGGSGVNVCTSGCQPGATGATAGAIERPAGVAAETAHIYVANAVANRIDVFSSAGDFEYAFGEGVNATDDSDVCTAASGCQAGVATGPTAMSSPRDVIAGDDGNLYVADFGNERVDVFAADGEFIRSFGASGQGELSGPVALVSDGLGGVYVADQGAQRIVRFAGNGGFLDSAEAAPNVSGVGLACAGNVFATERATSFARVARFGEPDTPPPPCASQPISVKLIPFVAPSNKVRFNGLRLNRRSGTAVIFVRVPAAGRVILHGRGVRRIVRVTGQAKRVRLVVRPKVRLMRYLKKHGKGRIRVQVTFRPDGGEPRTIEKAIVLRRKR